MSVMSAVQNQVIDSVRADLYQGAVEILVDDYFTWAKDQAEWERMSDELFGSGYDLCKKESEALREAEYDAWHSEQVFYEKSYGFARLLDVNQIDLESDVVELAKSYQN